MIRAVKILSVIVLSLGMFIAGFTAGKIEENNNMELIIKGQEQSQQITWNYEDVKAWATEAVAQYANMIVEADQIAFAKEKRADLNKLAKALDDARKAEKKKCLQPYEQFEKEIKEVVAIVNDASKQIDDQLKAFEEQRKAEKQIEIEQEWEKLEKPAEWLELDHIMQSQWLNASYSMSKIRKEMAEKLENITNDLAVIRQLPEFSFEAEDYYSNALDLAAAMREVQRLHDQQQRKAEAEAAAEAAKKAEQEIEQQEVAEAIPQTAETEQPAQRSWVRFEAFLSQSEAIALKEFFNAREINFRAIR